MKYLKTVGAVLLAILAIGAGIFVRTAKDGGSLDFWKKTEVVPVKSLAVIDPDKQKQMAAITLWLSGLDAEVIEKMAVAHNVLSINYKKPFPNPPYFTDTACGLYILDSTLSNLKTEEKQSFAVAFNSIFEEGISRSMEDLFGFTQRFRPTPAAATLRELMMLQIESTLDAKTLAELKKHFADTRYASVVVSNPTPDDCKLIPGIPQGIVY